MRLVTHSPDPEQAAKDLEDAATYRKPRQTCRPHALRVPACDHASHWGRCRVEGCECSQ